MLDVSGEPEGGRGLTGVTFELSHEIAFVGEAATVGDFLDGIGGGVQQLLGHFETVVAHVAHQR